VKIRLLGSRARFVDFDNEQDCAWCLAALRFFERVVDEHTVHLENDQGVKRTVTCTHDEPLTVECEPYVFFSGALD
jgi:hypothetical protein